MSVVPGVQNPFDVARGEPRERGRGSVHVLTQAPARRPVQAAASPAPAARRRPDWLASRWLRYGLGALSLGLLLLAWHLATLYRLEAYVRFGNIPTPTEVAGKVAEAAQSTRFLTNIGYSVRRVFYGFLWAIALGVPLGLLVGRYRPVRYLATPVLELFRPIPAIAWVPMAIMLWPSNEVSIVFITFLGAFFPIVLNTIRGVDDIDPVLLRAGKALGAGEASMLLRVVLPAALPHIFTGMALGMGVAWVSLIAAEMISGQFGIGYYTWEAYSLVTYSEIALGMLTIGLLGLACSGLIWLLARVAMPWRGHGPQGSDT